MTLMHGEVGEKSPIGILLDRDISTQFSFDMQELVARVLEENERIVDINNGGERFISTEREIPVETKIKEAINRYGLDGKVEVNENTINIQVETGVLKFPFSKRGLLEFNYIEDEKEGLSILDKILKKNNSRYVRASEEGADYGDVISKYTMVGLVDQLLKVFGEKRAPYEEILGLTKHQYPLDSTNNDWATLYLDRKGSNGKEVVIAID